MRKYLAALRAVILSAMFLSLFLSSGLNAQTVPLGLTDVFEIEYASDPQISPDGKSVVYVRNYFDIMTDRRRSDLWVVGPALSNQPFLPDLQISNPSSPRWSPDGKRLAFVTVDLNGNAQIFCYWLESGKIGRLTKLTQAPNGLSWSPDGSSIAFFMHVPKEEKPFAKLPGKPDGAVWSDPPKVISSTVYRADGEGYLTAGFTHLFVISSEGGTPRKLTEGDFDHGGRIAWTPDGKSLIISANRAEDWIDHPLNSELFKVTLEGGAITKLTDRYGPDNAPAISPDGRTIAYVGFDDKLRSYENSGIYVIENGGAPKLLTGSMDRSANPPVFDPTNSNWIFTYSDNGNSKLASVDPSGKIKVLASDLGSNANERPYDESGLVSVSRTGTIAFTVTTPEHPGDVAILESGGTAKRLTDLNSDLLSARKLGDVREIRYKSSFDGREVQGWYITPPDFDPTKKYPLILEIHGGPFADYGDRFSAELQLYAAAGYVVLYTNPRGSTSYGEEFANLIHHNYPGNDYDDLITGVDAMIAKGFIDDKRLYVTGGSGGGVLTAWIVGKTDRFRAAVVAKPVINWYSFVLTSDATNFFYKYWFGGFPWEKQDQYMKHSPISLVGDVKTPTMLLTGESDFRTPIEETEQFYAALKLRKVETAMVRIPGASHGIASRPSRLISKVSYILAWFEKHSGHIGQ
jgi:dipeptidyl aminopeptidase/acylaminoacyl peptidase